jgi:hypothetical protein
VAAEKVPMTRACLAVCAALLAFPAHGWACAAATHLTFNQPAALEGVLKAGKGTHEAQGAFEYVYLALDTPVCVDAPAATVGDEDPQEGTEAPIDRVQIAGAASTKQLPIGSRVSVEGTLFGAHTMWHAEDVLIDAADVDPR